MTSFIKGHYQDNSGAFNSGRGGGYEQILEHLEEVLRAAHPGGDPYWHGKGVVVTTWIANGVNLITGDLVLNTVADLHRAEVALGAPARRQAGSGAPASPAARNWETL